MIIDFGRCKKIANHKDMLEVWSDTLSQTLSVTCFEKSIKSSSSANNLDFDTVLRSSSKPSKPDFCKLLEMLFYSTFSDEKKHDEFMWIKRVDEEDTDILFFLHKMHSSSLEKQRIDQDLLMTLCSQDFEKFRFSDYLYDMINDTNTYNGICTTDNTSRIYRGSYLWSYGFGLRPPQYVPTTPDLRPSSSGLFCTISESFTKPSNILGCFRSLHR